MAIARSLGKLHSMSAYRNLYIPAFLILDKFCMIKAGLEGQP
uniref:Uncharacterized protein n=1 Tax=Arundo donax TaxID=35708 RepID=A0A0A8ZMB4_ARUDO